MTGLAALKAENVQHTTGKYLTFMLADEHYGVEILKVRDIVGMLDITPVPRTPQYVKGVVNLRGKIIPVVDLRLAFEMPAGELTPQTCIIVVHVGQMDTGLLVDRVLEVLDIATDEVEETPSFGADVDTAFILGLAQTGDRVTILLDIDHLLAEKDLAGLKEAASLGTFGEPQSLASR
jgi:purine-binding chemotaxis protein CheW